MTLTRWIARLAGSAVGGWLITAWLWQGLDASPREAGITLVVVSGVLLAAWLFLDHLEVPS